MKEAALGWLGFFLICAAQPGVRSRAWDSYSGDDFWTLSQAGQIGLSALSFALITMWFIASAALASRLWRWSGAKPVAVVEAAALAALFTLIHTASPQIYYAYYQQIIPGLPAQWVISAPPWETVSRGLSLSANARLAEHLASGVFWATILASLWRRMSGGKRLCATVGVIALPFALRAVF